MTFNIPRWGWIVVLAACCFMSSPASAQDMKEKFYRGFANMTGGVVEIPGCITDVSRRNGPWKGFTLGFLKGIGMVPVRTVVGVFEFLTFYVPVPQDYEPVLTPATPYGYWDVD